MTRMEMKMATRYFATSAPLSTGGYWAVTDGVAHLLTATNPDVDQCPSRDRRSVERVMSYRELGEEEVAGIRAGWSKPKPPPAKCPFEMIAGRVCLLTEGKWEPVSHSSFDHLFSIIFAAGQVAGMAHENNLHRQDQKGFGSSPPTDVDCGGHTPMEQFAAHVLGQDRTGLQKAKDELRRLSDRYAEEKTWKVLKELEGDADVKPDPYDGLQGGDR